MTSTPLRQFFPTLGVVILLGFFLYNMTAGTPGAQEADLPAPGAGRGRSHGHHGQVRPPSGISFHLPWRPCPLAIRDARPA